MIHLTPKYQYGYEVPRDYAHAVRLDKQNRNTKWQDAIRLKLKQLEEYSVFIDHGIFHITTVPPGYQIIKVHLDFAVKHDGRHKARMVADGHLTQVPLNSVYAGVLSLGGLQLCLFVLGELNNMEAYATDIGSAYLESTTKEKVCIKGGPEFGPLAGDTYSLYTRLSMD